MSAAPDHFDWVSPSASDPTAVPAPGLTALLEAAGDAVGCLADGADLRDMADRDAVALMGTLTTLVGRLDGLRVGVAREVRDRDIAGLRGTRTLSSWLRADARLADDAWKLQRLAAMGPDLPRITALLSAGTVSLAQAATACWQISQLPHLPVPPGSADPSSQPADSAAADRPGPVSPLDSDGRPGERDSTLDLHPGTTDPQHGNNDPNEGQPSTGTNPTDPAGPRAADAWAGLWRAGDVHAAADELFAAFLPGLDGTQLRQLGAHLREAASPEQRAREDRDDYAARSLRITRSFGGNGEISGRLHREAAEQVIAAFEELAAKTGPDDKRTKAQRWADALARLTASTPDLRPAPDPDLHPASNTDLRPAPDPDLHPAPAATPGSATSAGAPGADSAAGHDDQDDDQPSEADPGTGHNHPVPAEHPASADHPAVGDRTTGHSSADSTGGNGGSADPPGAPVTSGAPDRPGPPAGTVPAGYRRPRVIVTVPLPTLLGQPLSPGATLGSGTPLTAETARRLACDAEVIRLITNPHPPGTNPGQDAIPGQDATDQLTARLAAALAQLPPPLATPSAVLDIGRKSPGWTPRQRDALHVQYGGHCAAPRCTGRIDVIHHILHWLYGGKTQIINGCPFCDYHHWLVHEGGWLARKHPDGTVTLHRQPPGWRPGTVYRRGQPLTE